MAGFSHVAPGDLAAVKEAIDDQTISVMLSPIDFTNGGRVLDAEYLLGLRELCDERDLLLIFDETQVAFGSSGAPTAYSAIADIRADIVAVASGLFSGMPGGIVMASQQVTGEPVNDAGRYPLLAAVAGETVSSMQQQRLPQSAVGSMNEFAVALAERLSGFEFIRDVNVLGMKHRRRNGHRIIGPGAGGRTKGFENRSFRRDSDSYAASAGAVRRGSGGAVGANWRNDGGDRTRGSRVSGLGTSDLNQRVLRNRHATPTEPIRRLTGRSATDPVDSHAFARTPASG